MGMSFAEKHPELASEFSERNLPLMASDITYGSNKKYWWSGKCGHEWLASPKSRHSGEGCPYCAGMRVLEGFNDLASIKPELVDEWSSENEPLKPNNVNAASHRKVRWKGRCGHEWTAEIRARVKGTGCPYCSNIIIAKDGDHVVGFTGYGKYRNDDLENTGEVFAIYILAEYYGHGVGYQLMQAALSKLSHYSKVAVWVLKDNERAIRFYERCGYCFDGREETLQLGSPVVEARMILDRPN